MTQRALSCRRGRRRADSRPFVGPGRAAADRRRRRDLIARWVDGGAQLGAAARRARRPSPSAPNGVSSSNRGAAYLPARGRRVGIDDYRCFPARPEAHGGRALRRRARVQPPGAASFIVHHVILFAADPRRREASAALRARRGRAGRASAARRRRDARTARPPQRPARHAAVDRRLGAGRHDGGARTVPASCMADRCRGRHPGALQPHPHGEARPLRGRSCASCPPPVRSSRRWGHDAGGGARRAALPPGVRHSGLCITRSSARRRVRKDYGAEAALDPRRGCCTSAGRRSPTTRRTSAAPTTSGPPATARGERRPLRIYGGRRAICTSAASTSAST